MFVIVGVVGLNAIDYVVWSVAVTTNHCICIALKRIYVCHAGINNAILIDIGLEGSANTFDIMHAKYMKKAGAKTCTNYDIDLDLLRP